jgi:hypothetical protein
MLEDGSKVLVASDFGWLSLGNLYPFMFAGLIGLPALLRVLTGNGASRILATGALVVSLLLWLDIALNEIAGLRLPGALSPAFYGGGDRQILLLAIAAVPMALSGFFRGYGNRWPDILHGLIWVLLPVLWYLGV